MNASSRVQNLLLAAGMILLVLILLLVPDTGPLIIALVLGISLIVFGIRTLISYFTKYRHMIGGRISFYTGVLTLDLGLLIGSSYNGTTILILFYLLGLRAFTGVVALLRALESRRNKAHWKFSMFTAVFNLAIVVVGVLFMRNPVTVVYIYCIGLVLSAIDRIISSFRKTEFKMIA